MPTYAQLGSASTFNPAQVRMKPGNERTIVSSIINRIAIDVADIDIEHVQLDENERFVSMVDDGLNTCLTLEANIDQTARSFKQDLIMTLCDEGYAAVVPTTTDHNPLKNDQVDYIDFRIGHILQWFPQDVQVRVYDDEDGQKKDIVLPKRNVAIIENPFYSVMNETNSTLRRLTHKLNLLDAIDNDIASGKLDIIIQLPYIVKSEKRKEQAEARRKDIEMQLTGSKYGIAYTDGTERITQLNRPAENNLLEQIKYLNDTLFAQLSLTQEILNGTADEKTMLNYYNMTIVPFLDAITLEFKRKFLSLEQRMNGESIAYFRDPFKLVPVSSIADIVDKLTRNEVLSSNETRAILGYKPVNDPRADELRNKNLNKSNEEETMPPVTTREEAPDEVQYSEALSHYGTQGMKWGVRNGPPYPIGKGDIDNKSLNPNVKHLPNYKGKLYCISQRNMDGETLVPRIPDNYLTKNGYEDADTPRVCFAPSVDQCLIALSQNNANKSFYVYEPEDQSKIDVYKPNTKAVPDSKITGELWAIQPVKLKRVGQILCTEDAGEDGMKYTYGNGKTAELYRWNYEWKGQKPSK